MKLPQQVGIEMNGAYTTNKIANIKGMLHCPKHGRGKLHVNTNGTLTLLDPLLYISLWQQMC
jgi:hypothetical protein